MIRRVALVSHSDLNIARFRSTLIRELVRDGVEVFVCVPEGPYVAAIEQTGAVVLPYPAARGSLNPMAARKAVAVLRERLHGVEPDLVHSFTHMPNIYSRLAAPKRFRPGRVVNSVTGLGSLFLGKSVASGFKKRLIRFLYRRTASRCGTLVFQNEHDLGYFQQHELCGRSRTLIIPGSGVDLDAFSPDALSPEEREAVRRELGIEPGDVAAIMAGRLIRDKGVAEFVEAARLLAGRSPRVRFLLVGDADPGNPGALDRDFFNTLPSNIVHTGWREDMARIWAAGDIAVLPSYGEGMPVSLQEALASGLPVVATDVPGCRDVAAPLGKEEHALLVPPRDVEGLALAIERLAGSKEMRQAMGSRARAKAEHAFNAQKLARDMVSLYAMLLEGP